MLNANTLSQLKQLKTELQAAKPRFQGVVRGTSGKYGFVSSTSGDDFFIPPEQMARVLPGDTIEFTPITQPGGKPSIDIEQVIASPTERFLGRMQQKDGHLFVAMDIPSQRWLLVPNKSAYGAKAGDLVSCQVTQHPFPRGKGQAEVNFCFGAETHLQAKIDYCIEKFSLSSAEPLENTDLATLDSRLAAQRPNREDLSHLPFITIDSESTTDMDDALYAQSLDDGQIEVWVAIADPCALIANNGTLEQQAASIATSTYFPRTVLNMLPKAIATDRCSLQPQIERLALVFRYRIDLQGQLSQFSLVAGIIKSQAKLSYREVNELLGATNDSEHPWYALLQTLNNAAQRLYHWRQQHTAVMAERADYRFEFNDIGQIKSIHKQFKTASHRLVEEHMLAVKRQTADFLVQHQAGLFNQHLGIRTDKLDEVKQLLRQYLPDRTDLQQYTFTELPQFIELFNAAQSVHTPDLKALLLRFTSRSQWSTKPAAHMGLGFACYTTVTSPIRRYIDFALHRQLHQILAAKPVSSVSQNRLNKILEAISRSRRAAQDMDDWLRLEWLMPLKGQSFVAQVKQCSKQGIQVILEDNGAEAWITLPKLKSKPGWQFDPQRYLWSKGDQQVLPGQRLQVKLQSIDLARRQMGLVMTDAAVVS